MHEWYLTEELLDTVCTQANQGGIARVTRIQVELGEDCHIPEDSLHFCFQLLSVETIASEAVLEIKPTAGRAVSLLSIEGEQQHDGEPDSKCC